MLHFPIDMCVYHTFSEVFKELLKKFLKNLKDVNFAYSLHEDNYWSQAGVWPEIPGPSGKSLQLDSHPTLFQKP